MFRSLRNRLASTSQRRPVRHETHLHLEALEDRWMPSQTPMNPCGMVGAARVGSAPAAPSLVAIDNSNSQISLQWNRVSNATSYLVDEWECVRGTWQWVEIASYNSNIFGCSIRNLSGSITYYFDVAAVNSSGTTWAPFQSATTVDHPLASGTYTAVNGSLFGPNGPSFTDVHQGGVGDCWLMASFAEVAARAPSDIKNMFTYVGTNNENGTIVSLYSVRLYDSKGIAHSVLVDTELPSDGNLYDHPANGVLWVALAEKAYAQANGSRWVTTGNGGSDSYNALNGGSPSWALQAITGKPASYFSINPSNIASALNSGKLVVIDSSSHPASSSIVDGHAYAVVACASTGTMPFEVYNPWGAGTYTTYNGHQVYGSIFYCNGAFLQQNYLGQEIGVGAAYAHGNLDGAFGVAVVQVSMKESAASVASFMQAVQTTSAVMPGNAPNAGTISASAELPTVLARETHSAEQPASDALWMEAGQLDRAGRLLGQTDLLFRAPLC